MNKLELLVQVYEKMGVRPSDPAGEKQWLDRLNVELKKVGLDK